MGSGAAAERELSNRLEDDHGWAAMPAGGSGSGTERPRPDVWAAHADHADVVVEVKRRTTDWPTNVYFDQAEIDALESFASRAGARPWVAIRPHRGRSDQDWHCLPTAALGQTDGGRFVVRRERLPALGLSEVVGDE